MAFLVCACVIGLLAFVAMHRSSASEQPKDTALDRGLEYLIKDVTRSAAPTSGGLSGGTRTSPMAPSIPRTHTRHDPRTRLARSTPADALIPSRRTAQLASPHTPADAVLIASRLQVVSMSPPRPVRTAAGSDLLPIARKTGFEAEDDAPTTILPTYQPRR